MVPGLEASGINQPTWQDPEESTLGPEQGPPWMADTRKSRGDDEMQMGGSILGSRDLEAMSAVVCNFISALGERLCHFPLLSKPACCYYRIALSC